MQTGADSRYLLAGLLAFCAAIGGCRAEEADESVSQISSSPSARKDVILEGCLLANRHRPAVSDCEDPSKVILMQPSEDFGRSKDWLTVRSLNLLPPQKGDRRILARGNIAIIDSRLVLIVDKVDYLD